MSFRRLDGGNVAQVVRAASAAATAFVTSVMFESGTRVMNFWVT